MLTTQDTRERIGALKVLLAYCTANPEGQQALTTGMHLPQSKGSQPSGLQIWLLHPVIQTLCPVAAGSLNAALCLM